MSAALFGRSQPAAIYLLSALLHGMAIISLIYIESLAAVECAKSIGYSVLHNLALKRMY